MSYKDCTVTTIKYTVAKDEEFSDVTATQQVYDTDGGSTAKDRFTDSDDISVLLDEMAIYTDDSYECLEILKDGAQVEIILMHPNTEEEGAVQVITSKKGKTNTNPPETVSRRDIGKIMSVLWYADQMLSATQGTG